MYVTLGKYGVYRSTDGGATFSARNSGMEATVNASKPAISIVMSPVDAKYLYVSYSWENTTSPHGYFYSHDGGANWIAPTEMDVDSLIASYHWQYGAVIGNSYVSPTAVHPTNKNIAIATCNGEHPRKTLDGADTWKYCGDRYTGGP